MLKNQKGITLVSLVITIVVLLILATVAITLAFNTTGLFSHAGNAANQWNEKYQAEDASYNTINGILEKVPNK